MALANPLRLPFKWRTWSINCDILLRCRRGIGSAVSAAFFSEPIRGDDLYVQLWAGPQYGYENDQLHMILRVAPCQYIENTTNPHMCEHRCWISHETSTSSFSGEGGGWEMMIFFRTWPTAWEVTIFIRRSACFTNSSNDGAGCKASNVGWRTCGIWRTNAQRSRSSIEQSPRVWRNLASHCHSQ